jgi:hypothetical protein
MKRILLVSIMVMMVPASAIAQEWFEAAESSGLGYDKEICHPIEIDKKEVKIDEGIFKEIESLSSVSNFEVRNYEAGGSSPAGALGVLPSPPGAPPETPNEKNLVCTDH